MNSKAFNLLAGVAQGKECPRSAWSAVPGRSNPLVAQIILWICLVINSVFSFHSPAAGVWTPLANLAPDGVELMLLLPDGTVMAADEPGGTNYGRYQLFRHLVSADARHSRQLRQWHMVATLQHELYPL
jgi:hypothetical protein